LGEMLLLVAEDAAARGGDACASFAAARAEVQKAAALAPRETLYWSGLGEVDGRWADATAAAGQGPSPFVARAVEACRKAAALDRLDTSPHVIAARALSTRVVWEVASSHDPSATLAAARKEVADATRLRPEAVATLDAEARVELAAARAA